MSRQVKLASAMNMNAPSETLNLKTNSELMARRTAALSKGVGQGHALFAETAMNAEIWDVEGRRWIDFCAGIAVVNTVHCHPRVVEAARHQFGVALQGQCFVWCIHGHFLYWINLIDMVDMVDLAAQLMPPMQRYLISR